MVVAPPRFLLFSDDSASSSLSLSSSSSSSFVWPRLGRHTTRTRAVGAILEDEEEDGEEENDPTNVVDDNNKDDSSNKQQENEKDDKDDTTTGNFDKKPKTKWPELVGTDGEQAIKTITAENPEMTNVVLVPEHSIISMDLRPDRVRVFVKPDGTVADTPKMG